MHLTAFSAYTAVYVFLRFLVANICVLNVYSSRQSASSVVRILPAPAIWGLGQMPGWPLQAAANLGLERAVRILLVTAFRFFLETETGVWMSL